MSGGARKVSAFVVLLVLSGIGLIAALPAQAVQVTGERLVLSSDGAATVFLEVQLEVGVNEVPLPAQPVPASIVVEYQGEVLPAIYEPDPPPGTLIIAVEAPGTARISYLAAVTVENGVVTLSYKPVTGAAELVVEPGIVLLNAPATAKEYRVEGDKLVIVFTGAETIRYTVSVEPQQPAEETMTQQPAETGTQTETATQATDTQQGEATPPPEAAAPEAPETPGQAGQGDGQDTGGGIPPLLIAVAAAAIVAVAVAAFLVVRRRGEGGGMTVSGPVAGGGGGFGGEATVEITGEELDDVDKRIVEVLRQAGGELYQSEIQRITGLPKTTVWRHIRKLSEAGIVEVIREGKANRVRLLRDPFQRG